MHIMKWQNGLGGEQYEPLQGNNVNKLNFCEECGRHP